MLDLNPLMLASWHRVVCAMLSLLLAYWPTMAFSADALKVSNTCKPLNRVEEEGAFFRKAFTAIPPLVKTSGHVK